MNFSQRAVEAAERAVAEVRGAIWTPNKPVSANYDHDVAVAALTAALTVDGVALQGWQDISTAPKDGMCVLAHGKQHGTVIAYWANWFDNIAEESCEGWMELGSYDKVSAITHWQPLPQPPAASEGEERK